VFYERERMMYRVAVCDDDLSVCSQVEKVILEYSKNQSVPIEVDVYTSGEEMCRCMQGAMEYHIIFLDIELKMINGVEVGKIIREEMKNEIVHILYISAMQGYAMELFAIRPLNFLVKPLKEEDIIKNLEKSMELSYHDNKVFEFKLGKAYYKVAIKDIYYFASEGKKVKIITNKDDLEYYGKLGDVRNTIPQDDFLTIHKSYIVNSRYILQYKYDTITLVNGEELPISQAYRKEIRERLLNQRRDRK
jgi:DNA-binding LytR/AlgR family response regulator